MKTVSKYYSVDAETDGLWGNVFAVAAIVYDECGKEIDRIALRLPDSVVGNGWVIENVLPQISDMEITHTSYEKMIKEFSDFYMKHKDASTLWHMGHIVEAHLFREMHRLGYIGDWDAPYVPIEVASYLEMAGEPADSVDAYAKKNSIKVDGNTHNPLYDCEVAAKVFFHLHNQWLTSEQI